MDIMSIVKAAIFTPLRDGATPEDVVWGLVLCLWGEPGIGKTARLEALFKQFQFPTEVLSPGERGEGAFGVTPVPDGKVISYPPPDWVAEVAGGGVVFIDEATTCPPPLHPAIMGMLLARRVGGYKFGPRVRPMCAANPVESSAGGWAMSAPEANRMGHLDVDDYFVDAEAWANWLLGSNVEDPTTFNFIEEEQRVLAEWDSPWAKTAGVLGGFIKARPELLQKMPKPGSKDVARAWPSPRTWDMGARAWTSGAIHRLGTAEREQFLAAFVGSAAAQEFVAYLDKLDIGSPEDYLDGKLNFSHDSSRPDRTAAVLSACGAYLAKTSVERRRPRAAKLWAMLGDKRIMDEAMDYGFLAAKRLVISNLHTMKEAYPVLQRMLPVLEAAGISYDPRKAAAATSGEDE